MNAEQFNAEREVYIRELEGKFYALRRRCMWMAAREWIVFALFITSLVVLIWKK